MEIEAERISLVLVRASELHSKIATCIQKSSMSTHNSTLGVYINNVTDECSVDISTVEVEQDVDALLSICDAFDSLESHLSSLQAVQQQQQYEREGVIRDIENNRKLLLKKLSEYKGVHLDVIREAEAFASMKVDPDSDLFLPPYPTHSPNSLASNTSLRSRFLNARKLLQNGHNNYDESKKSQNQNSSSKLWGGLRFLVKSTAKTMLTLVGVVTLLSLAGFEPKFKKGRSLTFYDFQETRQRGRCPPGKVPVMENGKMKCIVKERVEIPFDTVAGNPDVNYGCG